MRVFIVSMQKFPRGDAGANYIQYLALALMNAGAEVIITGCREGITDLQVGVYKGIPFCVGPLPKSMERGVYFQKKIMTKIVRKYSICADDYVLCYSSNYGTLRYFMEILKQSHVYLIRVEDMQPIQYRGGILNLNYIFLRKAIRYACKKCAGTLAISKRINEEDQKLGARSMILPILADPFEYEVNMTKTLSDPIELIYPGLKANGVEDDIESIFKAILVLTEKEKKRINLNITGTNENIVKSLVGEDIFVRTKECVTIHGFLEYDDLVRLYQKMDFLFLPRKINSITKANFPSKIPELMSYGVVPICTAVGDYTSDYLTSENAVIIPDSSVSNCVKALRKTMKMSNRIYIDMRKSARKLVEDKLYYKLWGDKVLRFILNSGSDMEALK